MCNVYKSSRIFDLCSRIFYPCSRIFGKILVGSVRSHGSLRSHRSHGREGTYLTKINFFKFFRRFMFIYVSNQDQKFVLGDLEIRGRVRPYYFFDFPIVRSKIKIDVDLCDLSKTIRRTIEIQN